MAATMKTGFNMDSKPQIPAKSADALIADIMYSLKTLPTTIANDPATRIKLLMATRSLMTALETPTESLWRLGLQPFQTAVLSVAVELDLFTIFAEGGHQGESATELAAITDAEVLLLVRIMRALTAMGVFKETGAQHYAATPLSAMLAGPDLRDEMKYLFGSVTKGLAKLPEYLAATGFKNPTDPRSGPLQYAFDTKLDFFEWLNDDPKRNAAFNRAMTRKRYGRARWFHIYPFEERILGEMDDDPEAVLLVDVGGGLGHDVQALKAEYPYLRGRLIVQDLPQVVDEEGCKEMGSEAIAYKFFEQQPVVGARAYYMSSILHDWPDSNCVDILRNIAAAMKPGYSRLLLNEAVVPSVGTPLPTAMLDINMMIGPCGMERTDGQWRELLGSVGLEIVHISTAKMAPESIIEAVLKE